MSELGQVLLRAREEKGISLDDIQKMTKIQKRYLEAIERGHFHLLPGHFYARAFIKSYAEAVGLDSGEILAHFQSDLPNQPPQEQLERLRRRRASVASEPLQAGRWVTKTLLVMFVVLIIGVIYMAFVNSTGYNSPAPDRQQANPPAVQPPALETETPAAPPVTQTPAPTPVTPAQPAQPEVKPTLTFQSQQGANYQFVLSQAEKVTVKITATDRCWFSIWETKGKNKIGELMLKQGDEKVFEAPKTAYLVVGAPSAVQIQVNDQPIDMNKITFFPSYIHLAIQPQQ